MCNLVFYLPKQSQLETSAFDLGGEKTFKFVTAYPAASTDTTYATAPKPGYDFGVFGLAPGNAYNIGQHICPAGRAATFIMSAVGQSYLNYFQDNNPCRKLASLTCPPIDADIFTAIGLYITIS